MNLRRLVTAAAVLMGLTLAACGNSESAPEAADAPKPKAAKKKAAAKAEDGE